MRTTQATRHSRTVEAAIAGHGAARSPLVASWSRSARLHGLDPGRGLRPDDRLSEAEIAAARERMGGILAAAAPVLDRLFQTVGRIGCTILLSDREGLALERRGSEAEDADFRSWNLWPGSVWSEAQRGTNGIGTCLVEERVVTIHRDQHFLACNTALSCMSAPIHDPSGRIAGALDVSSCRSDLTEPMAHLIEQAVADAARRIETESFRAAFPRARILLVPGADRATGALLAVDADDLVVGATRAARLALGLGADLERRTPPLDQVLDLEAPRTLAEAERGALVRALARHGGNASAAARSLGISRATFHRKRGTAIAP